MPGRSIVIGRIAGIKVGISPLWLIIVALITWSLGAGFYPQQVDGIAPAAAYSLGLASALLLFASILAHEFGHALVARRRGVEVEEIDLWLLGGVAKLSGNPRRPEDELRFALAGPLVTLVIAGVFGAVALVLPHATPAALRALVTYQAEVNFLILVFNLVPAFPLDGGRVARALIWRRTGDLDRATAVAATLGRGFGYLLIGLGVLSALYGLAGGLWFVLIGFFLVAAARAELTGAQIQTAFQGLSARQLMSSPVHALPAELTLAEAVHDHIGRYRYSAFPIVDRSGRAVGLLTLERLAATPPASRSQQTVGDAADGDSSLLVTGDEDIADLLNVPAFVRTGRAIVVDSSHQPIGIVSITDVQRAIRAARLGADVATRLEG